MFWRCFQLEASFIHNTRNQCYNCEFEVWKVCRECGRSLVVSSAGCRCLAVDYRPYWVDWTLHVCCKRYLENLFSDPTPCQYISTGRLIYEQPKRKASPASLSAAPSHRPPQLEPALPTCCWGPARYPNDWQTAADEADEANSHLSSSFTPHLH